MWLWKNSNNLVNRKLRKLLFYCCLQNPYIMPSQEGKLDKFHYINPKCFIWAAITWAGFTSFRCTIRYSVSIVYPHATRILNDRSTSAFSNKTLTNSLVWSINVLFTFYFWYRYKSFGIQYCMWGAVYVIF